jgi:hypothetical protein
VRTGVELARHPLARCLQFGEAGVTLDQVLLGRHQISLRHPNRGFRAALIVDRQLLGQAEIGSSSV